MMLSKGRTAARPSSRAPPFFHLPQRAKALGYFEKPSLTGLGDASMTANSGTLFSAGELRETQPVFAEIYRNSCFGMLGPVRLHASNELVIITTSGTTSAT